MLYSIPLDIKFFLLVDLLLKKKNYYGEEDGHAWSAIKIDGKWLPFDAIWGIFSGKLPVSHIFKSLTAKQFSTKSIGSIKFENPIIRGYYLNK